ncbi:MAG: class I SAM-dependent methyltransferase [Rhodomicrobium sp.]|nr:class I SAM-dependent methyltransferase [Rhodomicrobium sp.]
MPRSFSVTAKSTFSRAAVAALLLASSAGASATAADNPLIDASVAHEGRSETDKARDAGRRPGDVLRFFGVEEGDHVIEIGAGGGYYSELLSRSVGDGGYVFAFNPYFFLKFVSEEIAERYGDGELDNVVLSFGSLFKQQLSPAQFDAAYFVDIYHDIFYSEKTGDAISPQGSATLRETYRILKPGGVVGIVDHKAAAGSTRAAAAGLHRIPVTTLRSDFEAAGFVFVSASDMLANSEDPGTKPWFGDPALKDATDRMVLKFKKPE